MIACELDRTGRHGEYRLLDAEMFVAVHPVPQQ